MFSAQTIIHMDDGARFHIRAMDIEPQVWTLEVKANGTPLVVFMEAAQLEQLASELHIAMGEMTE